MSLVIDMKTRAVLHTSGDDKDRSDEEPALDKAASACELRLAGLEPDRIDVWRRWVPVLLAVDKGSDPHEEE